MALNNLDKKILQEIVDVDGRCLDGIRCQNCPFRSNCLPDFLIPRYPTEEQRLRIAIDVLTHHLLIDEDMTVEDIKENWKREPKV